MLVYAVVVLHYLGGWLFQMFKTERILYSVAALGLIVGQGFGLEFLVRTLLGRIKGKKGK